MKDRTSKNTTKKKVIKSTTNINTLILNYNKYKGYIPILLGIVLLLIIYYVYKKYNVNQEGFLEQTPIDLLDRIKDNSYIPLPLWSNFLYNYQKGLEEIPLTFWKLNRDDNTFKFIGNAVSTDKNEITGAYTPTSHKTMLVQGDTKSPESAKLLFQHPYNLITTREKNNVGDLVPVNVFKKIENLKEIEERIEELTEAYKLLINAKKELTDRFNNKINHIKEKLAFKVSLFGLNNYFIKSNINGTVKLNNTVSFGNGKYNGVRIPLGAKVTLTFTNGKVLNYSSNIDNILNETKTAFNKITMDTLFDQNVDQGIFNKTNFNIFGPYGLTKPDNNPEKNFDNPLYKDIRRGVKISRRKGPRPDIVNSFKYPFNFIVSANKNYDAASFYGKEDIAKYIEKLIRTRNIRNNYIDDNKNNISNAVMYVGHVEKLDGLYYLFNSTIGDIVEIIRNPNVNPSGEHHIKWRNKDKTDIIQFVNDTESLKSNFNDIKKSSDINTVIEGFNDITAKGTRYAITNPMIDIDTEFINEELLVGDILEPLVVKIQDIINNVKDWGADLNNIKRINGTNINIDNLYDFNYTKELNTNNSMFVNTGSGNGTLINIKMPYFYINFVFKYPSFKYVGNRKFKEGPQVRNAFSIDSFYFDKNNQKSGAYFKNRDPRWIFLHAKLDRYRNCHDVAAISGEDVFLQNVNVSMNLTDGQLPFVNIIKQVLDYKLNDIGYFEQEIIKMTNKLNSLRSQIAAGEFTHYPMKIYRPIAPKYYKSVGDILVTLNSFSENSDYLKFEEDPNLQEYACVPEQCVREIREWLPIDKIYEYQKGSKYLAIYKNPYLQTFRAVTTPGLLPEGKVEKIVACVDRCKLVDDLIQADKCARTFYKAHKNVSDTFNLDPDNLLHERKSNIYKNKIVEREDRINTLKEVARRLQVQDDKANMINKAYNRHRLQDLVDKQKINMHTLVDNLEKGKNKISVNVKFDYDKASGTLNNLCNNNKLPIGVCQTLNNVLDKSARRALELDGKERLQYDKQALDALLRACPTPDMENLFKRSLVESNCGCYFTDEELNAN